MKFCFILLFLILPTEDIKLNSLTAVTSNANRSVFKLVNQIFDTTMCSKIRKLYAYRTTCSLINDVCPAKRYQPGHPPSLISLHCPHEEIYDH